MRRIPIPHDLLMLVRREITERGMVILTGDDAEEYVLQPAGGFIEPEDDEEEQIVLDAMEGDHGPLMTVEEAREYLRQRRDAHRGR